MDREGVVGTLPAEAEEFSDERAHLREPAFERFDSREVNERREVVRFIGQHALERGARLGEGSAIEPVAVEQNLAELEPALDLVGMVVNDRAEKAPRFLIVSFTPDPRGLEEPAVPLRQSIRVAIRLFRGLLVELLRRSKPFEGDAQPVPGQSEVGIQRDGLLERLYRRPEVAFLKRALAVEVRLERRKRRRRHGGDPPATRGERPALLGEQADGKLVHEVEGLRDVSERVRRDGGVRTAVGLVQSGVHLQLAADLDDAPEDEALGV